jgi:hypothetical protein
MQVSIWEVQQPRSVLIGCNGVPNSGTLFSFAADLEAEAGN